MPDGVPPDWRPYEYGHWVYTDDWGWYWVSDEHGRTTGAGSSTTMAAGRSTRGFGWFWVPGDEWAPAWVDWRYGDDYVGWAPLPPDDLIDAYESSRTIGCSCRRATWARRGCAATSCRATGARRRCARRASSTARCTCRARGWGQSGHCARLHRRPYARAAAVPTRCARACLAGTQGVRVAVPCVTQACGRAARSGASTPVTVQRTTTMIQPSARRPRRKPLGKGAARRLGSHPPRAAQGATAPAAAPAAAAEPARAPQRNR